MAVWSFCQLGIPDYEFEIFKRVGLFESINRDLTSESEAQMPGETRTDSR